MWQYQNTDELYHYGILGMRWGHRRYQNKDRSLTSKGKQRYTRRQKRGFKDANRFGQSFARVEDSTRIIKKNITPGKQLLVPSDVKNNYEKQVKDFTKNLSVMNKKYKDVETRIYTDKRKRLCSSYII